MTPGNGNAPSSQQQGHRRTALDTSHVLTHLIEGFVIQEGATPFPVERPSFSVDSLRRHSGDGDMDGLSATVLKVQAEPLLTCELCGKVDFAYVFKRSKRFCSTACAKRYNVGCTRRVGLFPNRKATLENERKRRMLSGGVKKLLLEYKKTSAAPLSAGASGLPPSGGPAYQSPEEPAVAPQTPAGGGPALQLPCGLLPSDPGRWDIQDVYAFISSLPGCLEIAEEFRSQEIDGQALLLLTEDHLMAAMNIKLGPALKVFAHISLLKDS